MTDVPPFSSQYTKCTKLIILFQTLILSQFELPRRIDLIVVIQPPFE